MLALCAFKIRRQWYSLIAGWRLWCGDQCLVDLNAVGVSLCPSYWCLRRGSWSLVCIGVESCWGLPCLSYFGLYGGKWIYECFDSKISSIEALIDEVRYTVASWVSSSIWWFPVFHNYVELEGCFSSIALIRIRSSWSPSLGMLQAEFWW